MVDYAIERKLPSQVVVYKLCYKHFVVHNKAEQTINLL